MTPFLVVMYPCFGVNPTVLSHILFGTNLFVMSFIALFSTFRYHQHGLVLWSFVLPVAASSVMGALAGSGSGGKYIKRFAAPPFQAGYSRCDS